VTRYGSYRLYQRYLCKDCSRTFDDETATVFEYSSIPLRKWYLAVYTYLRLNTSMRQLDAELSATYKTVYRRVQRFLRALDAPRPQLAGPVEIDELYVSVRKKGRERDGRPRSRGLATRGRGTYHEDEPPVFILADRATGETDVHPAKAVEESTIRLLLGDRQQESLTVYTDGFRAYEPLDSDDAFDRQYVVHGEGEYAAGDVHVTTGESHRRASDGWLSPHRGVSKEKLTLYIRALQLRKRVRRNPGDEALRTILETAL
jgi:transposase